MILTICTGNICRSPVAQWALRNELQDLDISSAGIHALVGKEMDSDARRAAQEQGLQIGKHAGQQITKELVSEATILLVMEKRHREEVGERWPFALGKTFLMGHFENGKEIADPYRMGISAHAHAVRLIIDSAAIWAPKIRAFL